MKPEDVQAGGAAASLDFNPYMVRCRREVFEICRRKDPPPSNKAAFKVQIGG